MASDFDLTQLPTRAPAGLHKRETLRELQRIREELIDWQTRLYAENRRSVLIVLQGMDASGKDGLIRTVFSGLNPQGVEVHSFKEPSKEELAHDFLWRIHQRTPPKGMIHVFNRSHYEDVLIGRVRALATEEELERRYRAIVDFERGLVERGIRVVKVMLHVGRDEQKARLGERLERPDKHWKYNPGDVDERLLCDDYQAAYQLVLERTSTGEAPWHVVPADRKWFARLAVQQLLIEALEDIDPQWPAADFDVEHEKERLAAS